MKQLVFLLSFSVSVYCMAQSTPVWSTYIPGNNGAITPSGDGNLFAISSAAESCGAPYTYFVLLGHNGNIIWDNAFDTLNNCEFEYPDNCSSIAGSSQSYAFSTHGNNSFDTNYVVISDVDGNTVHIPIMPLYNVNPIVGSMDDDHVYYSLKVPASLAKLDTLTNVIWAYVGPDSTEISTTWFDKTFKLTVLGCANNENPSDGSLRIIGIDTSGAVKFNTVVNLFAGIADNPKNVWYSSGNQLYGFAMTSTFLYKAFAADTVGNIIWQTDLISYQNSAWDSVHHVLHYTAPWSSQIKKCYKIDATSGVIIDSLQLDSLSTVSDPKIKVDRYGYIYFGYRQTLASIPRYRIDRYKPDYTLDWSGVFIDTSSGAGPFLHFEINDSGYVFIATRSFPGEYISKFAPPIINDVRENVSSTELKLYPNPVSSVFTYSVSLGTQRQKPDQYQIVDLQGRILMAGKCNLSGNGVIDISSLSPSVYFISILNEKDEPICAPKKIIKL